MHQSMKDPAACAQSVSLLNSEEGGGRIFRSLYFNIIVASVVFHEGV